MKHIRLNLLSFLFISIYCYGQDDPIPNAIIPPSPTAYNLGKYGVMKTGLFTGTVNAEIPLLEYKTPNLSLPVFLSYSSNGIRVEEIESRTGLIWNLNAGGVIIRNIKGNPDIYPKVITNAPYPEEIIDQLLSEFDDSPPPLLQMYLLRGTFPEFDTEYDVFSFNFLNIKGKFIVTSRGEVVQESKSSLRIEVLNNIDDGFMITDDQGIQYKFEITETTQVSNGPNLRNPPAVTAWYLNQVIHPKGDTINFVYNTLTTTFQYNGEQSYTKLPAFTSGTNPNEWNSFYIANSGYKQAQPQLNTISGKRISTITSNYAGKVLFNYDLSNVGQPSDQLLSNVKLFNDQEKLLENLTLSYTQTANNRVFLNEITFLDSLKKYSLAYYFPELFPQRNSFSQDYWGYFNGVNNQTLLPKDKDFDSQYPGLTFYGNREPNPTTSIYGMLKKITYPTGGYSLMHYEANTYYTSKLQNTFQDISLVNESDINPGTETASGIITSGPNQTIDIFVTLSNSSQCSVSNDPDVIRRKGGKMRLFDITAAQNITFVGTSETIVTITNGLGDRTYKASLVSGHQYRLYFTTFSCSKLLGNLRAVSGTTTIYYNEVTGGNRIRSIEHFSGTGEKNTTVYKYVDSLESEKSSGFLPINYPTFYSIEPKVFYSSIPPCISNAVPENQRGGNYQEEKLLSNSLDFVFNRSGANIFYKAVLESQEDNNENGCILHKFRTSIDGGGQVISPFKSSYIANKAVTNMSWDNGLESYTAYYIMQNGNLKLQKEEFFQYDMIQYRAIPMILLQQRYAVPCGFLYPPFPVPSTPYSPINTCSCESLRFVSNSENIVKRYYYGICNASHRHMWFKNTGGIIKCNQKGSQNSLDSIVDPFYGQSVGSILDLNGIYHLNAVYYHFYSFQYHLSSKEEVIYENGNTLTITTNFLYNDLNQIVSSSIQNSRGQSIKTVSLYPSDFEGTPVYDLMADRNMTGYVIKSIVSNLTTGKEISVANTEYKLLNNGFIVPKEVNKSLGGNALVTEVSFVSYNSRNNISELKKINGIDEAYLWGYNYQYPVALAVNASPKDIFHTSFEDTDGNSSDGDANGRLFKTVVKSHSRTIHFKLLAKNRRYMDLSGKQN